MGIRFWKIGLLLELRQKMEIEVIGFYEGKEKREQIIGLWKSLEIRHLNRLEKRE